MKRRKACLPRNFCLPFKKSIHEISPFIRINLPLHSHFQIRFYYNHISLRKYIPPMDLSFVGLCHRFFNFIVKCLATCARKSVTLGDGSHHASAQVSPPSEDGSVQEKAEPDPAHKDTKVEEMGDSSISCAPCDEDKNEEEAAMLTTVPQAQPPKKMVSINDTVEELVASKKKSKRKKGTEKMGSFNNQEMDEPKPLKSILKVGSKQDEDSYTNPGTTLGSS